jgi:GNAT superfamily N-acetyltransferase
MHTIANMNIVVRQARMEDKNDVMSFISKIWGGSDYIPFVWDKWLEDSSGKIHVIEADGKVVGMNRIKFLRDNCCWLQGARIHPQYRGRGLATILGMHVIKWAEGLGYSKFRLSCAVNNFPAIKQVKKMGFTEISRMSVYSYTGKGKVSRIKPKAEDNLSYVLTKVKQSREYKLSSGVLWDSFVALTINEEIVSEFTRAESAFVYEDSVCLLKKGMEEERDVIQACFFGYGRYGAEELYNLILQMNEKKKIFYLPEKSKMIPILRKEGAKRENSFILFEKNSRAEPMAKG